MGKQIRADYGVSRSTWWGYSKGLRISKRLMRTIPGDGVLISWASPIWRGKTSSGEVKVTKDLDMSLESVDVLIIEDIVDTGVTLTYLAHVLQRETAIDSVAALLDKPSSAEAGSSEVRRLHDSRPICGWLWLGYAEAYRNCPTFARLTTGLIERPLDRRERAPSLGEDFGDLFLSHFY
jgi:hypoxanthine phosphoribosyltransferase